MNRRSKGREVVSGAQNGLEQELSNLNMRRNHLVKNTWLSPSEFQSVVWGGTWESARLTSSQVMLMVLVWGPHFENLW